MFARILFRAVLPSGLFFVMAEACLAQHYVLRPVQAFVPMAEFGPKSPPEGLEGYCPVTLQIEGQWAKGDAELRAEFQGRTYFFASGEYHAKFLDDPFRFAPAFGGMDVVQQADVGVLADGFRQHGVFFRNRVFLFASEEHLQQFWTDPMKYAQPYMTAPRASGPPFNAAKTLKKYTFEN